MLREKYEMLGDKECPSASNHDQTTLLSKSLHDLRHPRSSILLQTH